MQKKIIKIVITKIMYVNEIFLPGFVLCSGPAQIHSSLKILAHLLVHRSSKYLQLKNIWIKLSEKRWKRLIFYANHSGFCKQERDWRVSIPIHESILSEYLVQFCPKTENFPHGVYFLFSWELKQIKISSFRTKLDKIWLVEELYQ